MASTDFKQTLLESGGTGKNCFIRKVSFICEFRF